MISNTGILFYDDLPSYIGKQAFIFSYALTDSNIVCGQEKWYQYASSLTAKNQ